MQFRYLPINADHYDDVLDHLRQNFYLDEPISKSVGMIRCEGKLTEYCLATMAEGLSLMALDEDNQIAGVRLCGITRPGDFERGLAQIADASDADGGVRLLRMLYEENLKLDLFNRLQCNAIFEIRIGSVAARYRRLGLAHKMLLEVYRRMRAAGVQYLKGESSGVYSQRLLRNNGFVVYSEIMYAERRMANGEVMFPAVEAPHVSLQIMIKKLDETEGVQ